MRVSRMSYKIGDRDSFVPGGVRRDNHAEFAKAIDAGYDHFFAVMRDVAPGQWNFIEPTVVAGKDRLGYFKLLASPVVAEMRVGSERRGMTPRLLMFQLGLDRVVRWTQSERKKLPRLYFKVAPNGFFYPENLHRSALLLARLAGPKIRRCIIARAAENLAARRAGVR